MSGILSSEKRTRWRATQVPLTRAASLVTHKDKTEDLEIHKDKTKDKSTPRSVARDCCCNGVTWPADGYSSSRQYTPIWRRTTRNKKNEPAISKNSLKSHLCKIGVMDSSIARSQHVYVGFQSCLRIINSKGLIKRTKVDLRNMRERRLVYDCGVRPVAAIWVVEYSIEIPFGINTYYGGP